MNTNIPFQVRNPFERMNEYIPLSYTLRSLCSLSYVQYLCAILYAIDSVIVVKRQRAEIEKEDSYVRWSETFSFRRKKHESKWV